MSLAKYNKMVRVFEKPENPEYCKLNRWVEGTELDIKGLYLGSGNFGETCSMWIGENIIVNLPSHLVETVKSILHDPESVEFIKSGQAKAVVKSYFDRNKRKQLTIEFM